MHDSVVFEALPALEQAVAPVRTLIDDFMSLFTQHENSRDDVPSRLKAMRRSYASSLQFLHWLQEFERTIKQFARRVEYFENFISCTALNYGFNLLPDDVLSEIFVVAAEALEEKVTLSLVCKRFRRVVMSNRKMWDGYWLESNQSPEQIIAIAEGHRFVSLKARILPSSPTSYVKTWVHERGLDLEEYGIRYHKFCVGLILSFVPEELEFNGLLDRDWEVIEPILGSANMRDLRSLVIEGGFRNSTTMRVLKRWRMPHLQNLGALFVPGAALARNLIQCSLRDIKEAQFGSLREFLAAARSLQDLQLYLSDVRSRFRKVCDLPSLRSLAVNFVPHPSLARHLIRFRLSMPLRYRLRLARLLYFLSSSKALEELTIAGCYTFAEDRGTIDALSAVSIPSVVSCELRRTGPTLIAKLHMPNLRTLKANLRELEKLTSRTRGEFRTSLHSMPSLDDLELNLGLYGKAHVGDLDEVIRYAPPCLESFSLKGCNCFVKDRAHWHTSPARNWKLIHFEECMVAPDFMATFIDYLRTIGLGGVKLQFSACKEWRNGIFGLDDVMPVEVDMEELDVAESDQ